jgi:FkbM family methyltransferase
MAAPISVAEAALLFQAQQADNRFEAIIAAIYGALLRPGDLAVDGGANRGLHTWPMASAVGSEGLVLAFEPIPPLATALAAQAARRGLVQVRVADAALAAGAGSAPFHWVRNDDGYSGLQPRPYPAPPSLQMLAVRTTTLDAALAGLALPWRFAKLDLEGGEFRALQGGAAALARHRPAVVLENAREGSATAYGYDAAAWFGFFAALDYALYDLFGRPFTPADWWRDDLPWYFIAVAAGSADERFVQDALPALLRAMLAEVPVAG